MKRRKFLKTIGIISAGFLFYNKSFSKKLLNKFNVVFILADDLGYGDIEILNPECKIPTPNINNLINNGMLFTDAHSGSAVCTPTRYGILTGRYAFRTRLQSGVLTGYSPPLIDNKRLTIAKLFKQKGYKTGFIGKWHLGWDWGTKDNYKYDDRWDATWEHVDFSKPIKNGPNQTGFDEFFGISASLDMTPYVYIHNNKVTQIPNKIIDGKKGYKFYRKGPISNDFDHEQTLPLLTEKAKNFITNNKNNPFFLFFSMTAPHTPIIPTKKFQGKSGIGPYGDFVLECDWAVGEIINTLKQNKLYDNTLIIFTSDNGPSPAANFQNLKKFGHSPTYIYRGAKADIYEGGHRIPLVITFPGIIKPKSKYEHIVCLTDFFATFAELLNIKIPDNAGEDSFSLAEIINGHTRQAVRENIVHHSINGSFAIRTKKWKLELCPGSGGWSHPTPKEAKKQKLPPIQLYDIENDPKETINVYNKYPEIVQKLKKTLIAQIKNGRSTPGKKQKNDVPIKIYK